MRCVRCAQASLDYAALGLQPFYAGALVRFQGEFHRVADPVRWAAPAWQHAAGSTRLVAPAW